MVPNSVFNKSVQFLRSFLAKMLMPQFISALLGQLHFLFRKSLQSVTETIVHEIRKFLQLQPALVLVTKAPIYAEGATTVNDFNR
jgi:hypothetical protein